MIGNAGYPPNGSLPSATDETTSRHIIRTCCEAEGLACRSNSTSGTACRHPTPRVHAFSDKMQRLVTRTSVHTAEHQANLRGFPLPYRIRQPAKHAAPRLQLPCVRSSSWRIPSLRVGTTPSTFKGRDIDSWGSHERDFGMDPEEKNDAWYHLWESARGHRPSRAGTSIRENRVIWTWWWTQKKNRNFGSNCNKLWNSVRRHRYSMSQDID